jgi:hypothetical protein
MNHPKNLKYKVLGTKPYKCVLAAFELGGFERTDGK